MNKVSKGEQKIENILKANHVQYQKEYTFKDLVGQHNKPLRFDFAIFKNNKLIFCLEYDGKQHFEYTPYFHKNIFNFYRQQEWDRRKNKYCLLNNIPLVRIPYWDFETFTFQDILFNPKYRVNSKYFNDNLKNERGGD